MGLDPTIKLERRKTDNLIHVIGFLCLLILSGLTWWMSSINAKADRVPVLEERISSIQLSISKIDVGVEKLLERNATIDPLIYRQIKGKE